MNNPSPTLPPPQLAGFKHVHLFAGIGGWALAARRAGWPDDRELWTGSAPCQPFSVAGKGKAEADDRHLWPHASRLIGACRPARFMGEQVAAAVGKNWLDGVFSDLERYGYACRATVVPACAVNGPHRRDRLWFLGHLDAGGGLVDHGDHSRLEGFAGHDCAESGRPESDRSIAEAGSGGTSPDADSMRREVDQDARGSAERSGSREESGPLRGHDGGALSDAERIGCKVAILAEGTGLAPDGKRQTNQLGVRGAWDDAAWIIGHDGKARRVKSGLRLLVNGASGRVGRLRAYGNAIVPAIAEEMIAAYQDIYPSDA